MYNFHNHFVRKRYGSRAKLLFTDTDNLCYEIKTKELYKDISKYVTGLFDTSNCPKTHPSGIPTAKNKKVIGMFKDETGGKCMTEFLVSGRNLTLPICWTTRKRRSAKESKSVCQEGNLLYDYKKCLTSRVQQMRKMNVIRSRKYTMFTEEGNKVALSADDEKRVIRKDGIHTYALGHYRLGKNTKTPVTGRLCRKRVDAC